MCHTFSSSYKDNYEQLYIDVLDVEKLILDKMGRNQQDINCDVQKVVNDEDERKVKINQNLARFLAEQTAQQRIAQKRQSRNRNLNLLQNNSSSNASNKYPNNCLQYGINLVNDLRVQSSRDKVSNGNDNQEASYSKRLSKACAENKSISSSFVKMQNVPTKDARLTLDEEEQQNNFNNNNNFSGDNVVQAKQSCSAVKDTAHHNNTSNKRRTIKVSKLIGRSMTFSYNHDGMLDPMDLLDPELRPIPPQPGCEPSMQIYQDHRRMATDYLNVRTEIVEMRQRKLELEEALKKSDEELLRSVISKDRQQQQAATTTAPQMQPDVAEVETYLQLESDKVFPIIGVYNSFPF